MIATDYLVRRIHASAADGEAIPVTLLYRRGLALDGSAPCLLYGYGAYGSPVLPIFSATACRSSIAA